MDALNPYPRGILFTDIVQYFTSSISTAISDKMAEWRLTGISVVLIITLLSRAPMSKVLYIIHADYAMQFAFGVFKIHDVSEAGSVSGVCYKKGNCPTQLDPLECCNEENIKYTTGSEYLTSRLQRDRQAFTNNT
jgi:hypothetical protein